MDKLIPYELFEGIGHDMPRKKLTLYHGVKNAASVPDILKNGFSLSKIKPLWTNDYAISALPSAKAVAKFFGKNVPILKIEFDGVVVSPRDVRITASSAEEYTKKVLDQHIDAVMLDGTSRQVFIYNIGAIKKVRLLE